MISETRDKPSSRSPSRGYVLMLSCALLGWPTLAVGLGAEIRMREGLDVAAALGHEGTALLVFAMSWLYTVRLIFWGRVSTQVQNLVRMAATLFVAAELPLAVLTVFLALMPPANQTSGQDGEMILVTIFTVIGVLCQISTAIWLLWYRKE